MKYTAKTFAKKYPRFARAVAGGVEDLPAVQHYIDRTRNHLGYSMLSPLTCTAIEELFTSGFCHPVTATGSGRFTRNSDKRYEIGVLLNLAGVKYAQYNNAPRGGQTGWRIVLMEYWNVTTDENGARVMHNDGARWNTRALNVEEYKELAAAVGIE